MLVYRVCSEREVSTILKDKSFQNIGSFYQNDPKKNNHSYLENKKYIHFFKHYESVFYLNSLKKNYVCTYDIPDSLLETGRGTGYYLDFLFFRTLRNVDEFAIESDMVQFDYLKRIDQFQGALTIDDYLDGDFQSCMTTIYSQEKKEYML